MSVISLQVSFLLRIRAFGIVRDQFVDFGSKCNTDVQFVERNQQEGDSDRMPSRRKLHQVSNSTLELLACLACILRLVLALTNSPSPPVTFNPCRRGKQC